MYNMLLEQNLVIFSNDKAKLHCPTCGFHFSLGSLVVNDRLMLLTEHRHIFGKITILAIHVEMTLERLA